MAAHANQYDLPRDIPEPVKRLVRQECGFACVACGSLGMHYDHFDPEFVDCKAHNASGIALLCPTCHQDKTSGRLTNEQVGKARKQAKERWENPAWRSHFSGQDVRLTFGSNVLTGKSVGLSFGPVELLRIDAGADDLEPWALTGNLVHGEGSVAQFRKNEVIACSGNWDVQLEGNLMTFRRKPADVVLQLSLAGNALGIERLDFRWPSGVRLSVDANGDVLADNLRHSSYNNRGTRWLFRKNTVVSVAGAAAGTQFVMVRLDGCRNMTINDMTFDGNEIRGPVGFADLSTFVNIGTFLSDDMLQA